jgi:hypothetical protein
MNRGFTAHSDRIHFRLRYLDATHLESASQHQPGELPMPHTVPFILIGFGSVNRSFVRLLLEKGETLARRYNLEFTIVGVSDSRGAVYNPAGLAPAALLAHMAGGHSVATFAGG